MIEGTSKDRDRSYERGRRGIEIVVEGLGVEEVMDLEIEIGLTEGISEERCHYCKGPGHFARECQKKKRDQAKQGEQKTQMLQIADITGRNWLDSWPGTMQEEAEVQLDIAET